MKSYEELVFTAGVSTERYLMARLNDLIGSWRQSVVCEGNLRAFSTY